MTIDASLNEVEGLAAKAARGAGLSWGLAEDTARAARWLAAAGLDWAPSLAALLGEHAGLVSPLPTLPLLRAPGAGGVLSPLVTGAFLDDIAAGVAAAETGPMAHPLWLLPFAARSGSVVGWAGAIIATAPAGLAVSGDRGVLIAPRATAVTWRRPAAAFPGIVAAAATRSPIAPAAWQSLLSLAARTYVPASALSRARGAGAGMTDND